MNVTNQHPSGPHRISFTVLVFVAAAVFAYPLPAQTPRPVPAAQQKPPTRQAFEVASIRIVDPHSSMNHNRADDTSNQTTFPANRLSQHSIQMISLICEAYPDIECGNVLNGPGWLRTNEMHYDLTAKVEGNAMLTQDQMRPMVRTLLEERFHLKVHREHRIVPGYALLVAERGAKLQPNKGGRYPGMYGSTEFKFDNVSTDYIAKLIGWQLHKPVADRTGLQGMYDVDLKFAPEDSPLADDPQYSSLPKLMTAVQDQFGLKLVPQKIPVDYLVVDHVDKVPTDN